jgi:predicted phosphoribosyltransferase
LLFALIERTVIMVFASREEAGRRLGHDLKDKGVQAEMVLGLPRGGVVVAAEVAHVLDVPLDVLVVRKIGHPLHREFAVGALAENDVVVFDEALLGNDPLIRGALMDIVEEEKARLIAYLATFHPQGPPDLSGKSVLLVDDGLATGATTRAAVISARKKLANRIIVAAPVASSHAVERLSRTADEVRALYIDPFFDAVGRYYATFSQTTDAEVLGLLHAA